MSLSLNSQIVSRLKLFGLVPLILFIAASLVMAVPAAARSSTSPHPKANKAPLPYKPPCRLEA